MAKKAPNEFQKLVRGMIRNFAVLVNEPKPAKAKKTEIKKTAFTKSQSQPKQEAKKRSRHIPLSVRFTVLRRDGHKCVSCGKSPPEVTLEVDHKEPFSKGGTNDISNLQTLCFKCNRGKGASS
ncbi:MAG: HNH endonuclease [Nostoc sp.]|uniref:HNH endonuclease n=1 Tax=Nostoc sp. TaxID=1180 RepID=UPI002FFBA0FB